MGLRVHQFRKVEGSEPARRLTICSCTAKNEEIYVAEHMGHKLDCALGIVYCSPFDFEGDETSNIATIHDIALCTLEGRLIGVMIRKMTMSMKGTRKQEVLFLPMCPQEQRRQKRHILRNLNKTNPNRLMMIAVTLMFKFDDDVVSPV